MPHARSFSFRLRLLLEAVEMLHHHSAGPFPQRVLAACQHLFPETWNGFELWDKTDGTHTGAINVPYDQKDLAERFRLLGELVPTQSPLYPPMLAGETDPMRMSDFVTHRQLSRTDFYQLGLKPVGIRHQVGIPVLTPTHVGGITFNKGGSKDFTDEDVELIRLLSRHIALAHEADRIMAAAQATQPQVAAADHQPLREEGLTRRESEVFLWMCQGKTDKEIAIILNNSHRTISQHVGSILRKLGVETRLAAVLSARRKGGAETESHP